MYIVYGALLYCVKTLLRRVVYLQLMPAELVRMRCQQLTSERAGDSSKPLCKNEQEKVH